MNKKMTLEKFYENLSSPTPPKTEFVDRVAKKCGLKTPTVRLWVKGKTKPSNEDHLRILSEETGIAIENLFAK